MKWLVLLVLVFFCLPLGFTQYQDPIPQLNGYVTRSASPTDFDVNGVAVICTPKTAFTAGGVVVNVAVPWTEVPYVGMPIAIFGKKDKKKQTIVARQVIYLNTYTGAPDKVKGFGLIDRVLSAPPLTTSGSILVQVDGYPVLVDEKTNSTFSAPLKSTTDVSANVWLAFHGERRVDGVVVAEQAVFVKNEVSGGESKLRNKTEYDPAAIAPNSKQNKIREMFLGWDPKKAAPYIDAAMQERVNRIGTSLVPKYQVALPDSDPTKVKIRFQLIDENKFKDAIALPSGIILVPHQVVERMQNDSQLAAVLADNMATVIAKQSLRAVPGSQALMAAAIASDAAMFALGPVGVAGTLAVVGAEAARVRREEEESGRIALGLMGEAKYDVDQAPMAWWLLASKDPKPISEIELPERAADLYQILGTYWKPASPLRNFN